MTESLIEEKNASDAVTQPAGTSHMGRIFRAASLVMVLFVISRVLGLIREMVIAAQFGTSADMDAYLAAFRIPDFLFYVVAGGALASAFIPIFTGYLAHKDMPAAWRLASATINWVMLILLTLGGIAAFLAPWLVQTLYAEFTPAQSALTVELMRWMLVATVLFGVSGVVMGILNAQQHFFLPALAPVIYNLAIILAAWFLGSIWGVRGLAVGVVLGAAGHLLVQIPGLVWGKPPMRYRPVFTAYDDSLQEVGRLMAPRVLGLAAVQINFLVSTILAATLVAGSVTALNYGWIIMLLPQGIIAQSVATALFPTLAALVAKGQRSETRRVFGMTLRSMLFLTLPASVGLIILAVPIVRMLLERGAFGAASTWATAWALALFSLGLVGHAVVEISARAFYAFKNTKTPVGIAILAMAINIILSLVLLNVFAWLGLAPHGGLALANSIAITFEMVILLLLLRRTMGGLGAPGLGRSVVKMSLATAGMALVLVSVRPFLPAEYAWAAGLTGILVGGIVYVGLAYILGLDELKQLERRILLRVGRHRGG